MGVTYLKEVWGVTIPLLFTWALIEIKATSLISPSGKMIKASGSSLTM